MEILYYCPRSPVLNFVNNRSLPYQGVKDCFPPSSSFQIMLEFKILEQSLIVCASQFELCIRISLVTFQDHRYLGPTPYLLRVQQGDLGIQIFRKQTSCCF